MIIIGKFLQIMEDLYISKHACIYLSMFDKMLVPWRGLQLLLYLGDVPLELFAPLITIVSFFHYLIKSRFVNSEVFTASTHTKNFKVVVTLENGLYVHLTGFSTRY